MYYDSQDPDIVIKKISLIALFSSLILLAQAIPNDGTLQAQELALNSSESETTSLAKSNNDPYKTRFFRVRGAPRIKVNTVSGGVEVYENEALDGVQVDLFVNRSFSLWSGARNLDNYRIILQQRGDNIIASVEDKRSGRNYKADAGIEFNFVIQTPMKASVEIQSMTGDISVQGISGNHFIQNHNGDIDLWRVDGETRVSSTAGNIGVTENSGTLFMKTVTGNVFIEKSSGEIRLKSVEGDIEVHEIQGTLVTSTVTGNIFSQFTDVSKGIFMESISGNIDLIIPGQNGYKITAEAMEFDFDELDLTQSDMNVEFRNASLTIRGGQIPINLASVSGKVTVKESN
jgi:hypothetical protein